MAENLERNYAEPLANIEELNIAKKILNILLNADGVTPTEVDEKLGCSYSAVRNSMSGMKKKGFARTEKEGRKSYYYPTGKAQKVARLYREIDRHREMIESHEQSISEIKSEIESMVESESL